MKQHSATRQHAGLTRATERTDPGNTVPHKKPGVKDRVLRKPVWVKRAEQAARRPKADGGTGAEAGRTGR